MQADPVVSWQLRSAVRRGVRLRREFFEAAEAAIAASGLHIGPFFAAAAALLALLCVWARANEVDWPCQESMEHRATKEMTSR